MMRAVLCSVLLAWASVASAAEVVWVTTETPSLRFLDSATPGPTFTAFSRLSVVYEDGGKLRVKGSGPGDFGWIEASLVTEEEPAEATDGSLPSIPGLDELLERARLSSPAP